MEGGPVARAGDPIPVPKTEAGERRRGLRIQCKSCKAVYNVKEDLRRFGKKILMLPCPKCGAKIPVRIDGAGDGNAEDAPQKESERLREKILASLQDLPPMPQVVGKAQDVMGNPNSDLKELAEVIKMDQALVIRILKMANSSYYGLPGKISSIEHATVLLGQKVLGEVITMAGVSDLLGRSLKGYNLDSGDLWRHSMAVAFGSKMIAEQKAPHVANDAFVAGLLHDAGKIILDRPVLDRKTLFEKYMTREGATFLKAETEVLGFDHAQIASEMCRKWNIPEPITKAIAHHHSPSGSGKDPLSYILHLADYVATLSGIGIGSDDILYEKEDGTLGFLGLEQKAVSEIMFAVMEACNQFEEDADTGA